MNEKRSSIEENAQFSLFEEGVGARQACPPPSPPGGGYQETCTVLKFSARPPEAKKNADPRLDELARMGIQRVWLEVAEAIGVDAFLTVWRILDAEPASHHKEGRLQLNLKLYRSYLRFQRNRYIEALARKGLKPLEIQWHLNRQLRESVSLRHISRIADGDRL
jgi:hypothetical protein